MADFILVIPKFKRKTEKKTYAPFVFLQLAAALEKNNFSSFLIDARLERNFLHILEQEIKKRPLCIGITSFTGFQTSEGARIAKFIKKKDEKIPVVWGGCHASLLPEQILRYPFVDVAVIGEGESTIVSLMREYRSHKRIKNEIKGIAVKKDGNVIKSENDHFLDLDSLSMPAWHLIKDKIAYYIDDETGIGIMTSRGCPHDCSFCYNAKIHKRVFRARGARKVLEEIDFLHTQFGIGKIKFTDDNFLTNRNRVAEICDGLRQKGAVTPVRCDARVDYLDGAFLAYLVKNGFRKFYLGIEHGSQRMLDMLSKGTTVGQIRGAITALSRHTSGGHTYSFMTGLPDETEEDIEKTWVLARWIAEIDPASQILLNIYTPYPGTELFDMLVKKRYAMPASLYDWSRFHWFFTRRKPWIKNRRLVRSLTVMFRLAFSRSENRMVRLLSKHARAVFAKGRLRPYVRFEFLYCVLRILQR